MSITFHFSPPTLFHRPLLFLPDVPSQEVNLSRHVSALDFDLQVKFHSTNTRHAGKQAVESLSFRGLVMELVDSNDFSAKLPDLSLFSQGLLIPAAQPEMKLDLRAPSWITVRRRNRELTVRFISCAFVSFRFVSTPRPRFRVETPGTAKEREEKERQEDR